MAVPEPAVLGASEWASYLGIRRFGLVALHGAMLSCKIGKMVDSRQPVALTTIAGTEGDAEPSSEVRRVETIDRPRILRIFTWLRGPNTEGAWLTVTDDRGTVQFEGPLSVEGDVEIPLCHAHHVERVRVLLETVRWHRQADVCLSEGLTEYVFV